MDLRKIRKNYWEVKDEADLYNKLIGVDYGDNPVSKKEQIEAEKRKTARWIRQFIPITSESTGLEIGTGTGFVIKEMATFSKHVYGCDISESFLDYARKECAEVKNISLHLITDSDFSMIPPGSLDYVYSHNVFIHLDLYEISDYLECIRPLLKDKAYFWFDILDAEKISTLDNSDFVVSRAQRKEDPYCKSVLQYNSARAVENIAQLLGYKVIVPHWDERCNTKFLLQKNSHFKLSQKDSVVSLLTRKRFPLVLKVNRFVRNFLRRAQ